MSWRLACLMIVYSHILSSFYAISVNSEMFVRVLFLWMPSFTKVKSLRNGKITLLFTNVGKSCSSCQFLTSQICILTLLAKIKFSKISELTRVKVFRIIYLLSSSGPCKEKRISLLFPPLSVLGYIADHVGGVAHLIVWPLASCLLVELY